MNAGMTYMNTFISKILKLVDLGLHDGERTEHGLTLLSQLGFYLGF